MRKSIILMLLFIFAGLNFLSALVNADGLVIQKRFDHNGNSDGYYLGDNALLGHPVYNRISKGGCSKYIGEYGSYVMVDWVSQDLFYTIGQSVKRYKGSLEKPYSLFATDNGLVYVGDILKDQVTLLSNTGSVLEYKISASVPQPRDIYTYQNKVYVASASERKIFSYDKALNPITGFQGLNSFIVKDVPIAVCADGGYISVLTRLEIQVYDEQGQYLFAYPLEAGIIPVDIDTDYYRNVYVLDEQGLIHKYRDNKYVCSLLAPGNGDYQLNSPNGFSIDRGLGNIVVTDDTGVKIYYISTAVLNVESIFGDFVSGIGENSNTIGFTLAEDAWVTLNIKNDQNQIVKTLVYETYRTAGAHQVYWNGNDNAGNTLPSGSYKVSIKAVEKYSAFNTTVQEIIVPLKAAPTVTINYLYNKIVDDANPVIMMQVTASEAMNVSLALAGNGKQTVLCNSDFNGFGMLLYDMNENYLEDGEYRAILTGKTANGRICSTSTNIYINLHPLQLAFSQLDYTVSPQLTDVHLDITSSEYANAELTLSNGQTVLSSQLTAGENQLVWNCSDASGTVLPDGIHTLKLKAFQSDVDVVTTNITVLIDSTPPQINLALNSNIISPIDSPAINDNLTGNFTINELSDIDAQIVDSQMKPIKILFQGLSLGSINFNWNGRLENNDPAPDGDYNLFIKATDLAGNHGVRQINFAVDNNLLNDPFSFIGHTSLVRALQPDEKNFVWLRSLRKFLWTTQNSTTSYTTNIILCNENGDNPRILSNIIASLKQGISISPDEKSICVNTITNILSGSNGTTFTQGPLLIFNLINEKLSISNTGYNGFPISGFTDPSFNTISFLASIYYTIPPASFTVLNLINLTNHNLTLVTSMRFGSFNPVSFSKDNKYILWNNLDNNFQNTTYIMNINNKSVKTSPILLDYEHWLTSDEMLCTYTTNEQKILAFYNVFNNKISNIVGWPNSIGSVVDISLDQQKLLISDGAKIYLLNTMQNTRYFITNFDSLGTINNYVSHNKSVFFSEDGNSIVLSGTLNGTYGIYKIDLEKSSPNNLTADINYPNSGIEHIEGLLKITGTAADSHFNRAILEYQKLGSGLWVKVKDIATPINQDVLGTINTFDPALPDGSDIAIRLTAYDKAGNVRQSITTNKVLNSAGYIMSAVSVSKDFVSSSGADISFHINENSVAVTGVFKDKNGATFTKSFGTLNKGNYSYPLDSGALSLAEGKVNFSLSAVFQGKSVSMGDEFTLDKTAPALALTTASSLVNSGQIELNGVITDDTLSYYQVTVNNALIGTYNDFMNNQVTGKIASVSLPDEGSYSIVVTAFDKAGNNTSKSIAIQADHLPPVCTIESPNENDTISKNLLLKGVIIDPNFAKYTVLLNDQLLHSDFQILNGPLSLNISTYEGAYELKVIAQDAAGNTAEVSRSIIIDNKPPTTTVTIGGKPLEDALVKINNEYVVNSSIYFDLTADSGDNYSTVKNTFVSVDGGPYVSTKNIHLDSGRHIIAFYSVDNLGNQENPNSFSLTVDNEPPQISCKIEQPFYDDGNNIFIPMNNNIQFETSDNFSGMKLIYYSIDNGKSFNTYSILNAGGLSLNNPGTNELLYYALDNAGNQTTNCRTTFFLDPVPPYTTLLKQGIHYQKGGIIYYRGSFNLSLSPYDYGSGIASTFYQLNDSTTIPTVNIPNLNGSSNLLEFYSTDKLGNEETHNSVNLIKDEEVPSVNLKIIGVTYTNESIYALPSCYYSIDSSDEKSGVMQTEFKLSQGQWGLFTNGFTLTEETNRIEYYALDNLTNVSAMKENLVILDSEAPYSSITFHSGKLAGISGGLYCSPDSRFNLSASDRLSGVNALSVIKNGVGIAGNQVIIDSEGTNIIQYFALDNLGNTEQTNTYIVISPIPDSTPPVTKIDTIGVTSFTQNKLFGNAGVQLKITAEDPASYDEYASGVANIYYYINGIWNIVMGDNATFSPVNGLNQIQYCSSDKLFNTSVTNTLEIIIDTAAPGTTTLYPDDVWTNQAVQIDFISQDGPSNLASGVLSTFMALDNEGITNQNSVLINTEGVHTIHFYSLDSVSNTELPNSKQVKVDLSFPRINISGVDSGIKYGRNGAQPVLNITDGLSGLQTVGWELRCNGILIQSFQTNLITSFDWSFTNSLLSDEGYFNYSVWSIDNAGNRANTGLDFQIDLTPPSVVQNLRHLFDGEAVYLEWDPVTNADLKGYAIVKDGTTQFYSITPYIVDRRSDGGVHQYRVSAYDDAYNTSGLSSNEIVNTSDNFAFVHPSTNQAGYYSRQLWIEAEEKANWNEYDLDNLDNLENNCKEDDDESMKRLYSWIHKFSKSKLKADIELEIALSNNLVPKEFFSLVNKDNTKKQNIQSVINLKKWVEGNYVMRVTKDQKNEVIKEDAFWFGVDNTAPASFLTVNGKVLWDSWMSNTSWGWQHIAVNIPKESASHVKLIAFDPVVNETSSGLGGTYYSLTGKNVNLFWRKYQGEEWNLSEGKYTLLVQSYDNTKFLWKKSRLLNKESLKQYEITVGGFTNQFSQTTNVIEHPRIVLGGVSDYQIITNEALIKYQLLNAVSVRCILDNKILTNGLDSGSIAVSKEGKHTLRINAISENGAITAREITFTVIKVEPAITDSLQTEFYNANLTGKNNTIYPWFKVSNNGTKSLDISRLKLRYYFTKDNNSKLQFECDHSGIQIFNGYREITSSVNGYYSEIENQVSKADNYLEISFKSNSGKLNPGDVLTVQSRIHTQNWQEFNQYNDYSFNPNSTDYEDWDSITAYYNDSIIYGVEP